MCESKYIHVHVRLNFTCISYINLNRFLDLISIYSLSKLERNLCFNVHIQILEFHNPTTKYGALA